MILKKYESSYMFIFHRRFIQPTTEYNRIYS